MQYLMAIDAGTGSVRAVIFDANGKQISVGQREWVHFEEEGVANSMTFDVVHNWELTAVVIREAITHAGISGDEIAAVSATSMREGIVVYDENGKALWGVANVDARADAQVHYLKDAFDAMEAEDYAMSGQTFALGALPRLMWLKTHRPEIYEKMRRVSMIGDWVLASLCGTVATDPSNAGTTGIFSLKERQWAPQMAARVGIKDDIFPPVLEPGCVMGTVSPEMAVQTGLSTQTKVVMGGGDVQLGAAGLGVVKEGQVAILGGSFWQQVVNIKSSIVPPEDMSVRVNPHVIDGLSQAEGITFFSGLIMRWFRDAFCDMEKHEAAEQGVDVYEVLEAKAAKVPAGSHGILPIFSDSMKYGKWYHAAPSFINLSIDPEVCNKASMFRSLQENACIVSAINLEKVKAFTGLDFEEIVFAGGASKGALWCQILADVTGCRIKVPEVKEATALGAAMCAAVGAGLYESIESASDAWVAWEHTYLPNGENTTTYETVKKRWQQVYEKQLALVDEGLVEAMWKAPGV